MQENRIDSEIYKFIVLRAQDSLIDFVKSHD